MLSRGGAAAAAMAAAAAPLAAARTATPGVALRAGAVITRACRGAGSGGGGGGSGGRRGLSSVAAAWGGWPAMHGFHAQAVLGMAELQSMTGMPWWATLAASAFVVKVATVPAQVVSTRAIVRLTPLWAAARKQVLSVAEAKGPAALKAAQWDVSATVHQFGLMRRRAGAPHPAQALVALAVRLPVFVVAVGGMRRMAELYFPGLEDGGVLWFANLCEPVRTMPHAAVLSGLVGGGIYLTLAAGVRRSGGFGVLWHTLSQCIGLGVLASGPFLPPAVYCYWLGNLTAGACERALLRAPALQRALGISSGPPPELLADGARLVRVAAKATAAGDSRAALAALEAARAAAKRTPREPTLGLALFGTAAVRFKERELTAAANAFRDAAEEFARLARHGGGGSGGDNDGGGKGEGASAPPAAAPEGSSAAEPNDGDETEAARGDGAASTGEDAEAAAVEVAAGYGDRSEREYALLQMQRSLVHAGLAWGDRRKELTEAALESTDTARSAGADEDDFDAVDVEAIAESAREAIRALEEAAAPELPSKDFRALALLTMAELKKDIGDTKGSMDAYKQCGATAPRSARRARPRRAGTRRRRR